MKGVFNKTCKIFCWLGTKAFLIDCLLNCNNYVNFYYAITMEKTDLLNIWIQTSDLFFSSVPSPAATVRLTVISSAISVLKLPLYLDKDFRPDYANTFTLEADI